jgi:hypothetical protein
MNKKFIGLITAVAFIMQLNGAENTIEGLKARKAQLERSYTASMLKLASVLSGMVSAATLGTAGYGVFQSVAIFNKMNNPGNIAYIPMGLLGVWHTPPSFWETMKEVYTKVLPSAVSGAKIQPSKEFEWTAHRIEKLPEQDQSTLLLGFGAPILTTVGIVSSILSIYLYKKAMSFKKEIEEIDQKIAQLQIQ